jgi:predicted Zn-dependent peptidase
MKKVIEWFLGLFFSKEAIDLVRREAAQEARAEMTNYKNRKFLTVKKDILKYNLLYLYLYCRRYL